MFFFSNSEIVSLMFINFTSLMSACQWPPCNMVALIDVHSAVCFVFWFENFKKLNRK